MASTGKVLRESRALREGSPPPAELMSVPGTTHPLLLLWLPALAPFRTPSYTKSGSVRLSLAATTCLSAPWAAARTLSPLGSHCPEGGRAGTRLPP